MSFVTIASNPWTNGMHSTAHRAEA